VRRLQPNPLVHLALGDDDMPADIVRALRGHRFAVPKQDAKTLVALAYAAAQPVLQIVDQHVGRQLVPVLQLAAGKPAEMAARALSSQHIARLELVEPQLSRIVADKNKIGTSARACRVVLRAWEGMGQHALTPMPRPGECS
jgi:hypothetical protein